jgi:hypothetical protein
MVTPTVVVDGRFDEKAAEEEAREARDMRDARRSLSTQTGVNVSWRS